MVEVYAWVGATAIIIDRDLAMCNTIHVVFPHIVHRYCYWHLQKHVSNHLSRLITLYEEHFHSYYDTWYNSSTIEECNAHWAELKEKLMINEDEDSWFQVMYRHRYHWVPYYLKGIFFAGMRSSQRSESINTYFDSYVNSQPQLLEFVSQYDKAVANRRATEAYEDFMTLDTKAIMHIFHLIEVEAGDVYTRAIFHMFQIELKGCLTLLREEVMKEENYILCRVGGFSEDKRKWDLVVHDEARALEYSCSCGLFENNGIL